ncbi:hypothetical protein [Xanthomonas vesicatoria]|uniref:hypothetical protein n=1 Tax=Xanthomonas vesicatoria TaxID=56460 RepID=UPI001E3300BC|nr:hypothetical protein [Xanthomonas vesicatoria]MCC8619248.1 hypothetical protein [Xanthomonas vesicatoria]
MNSITDYVLIRKIGEMFNARKEDAFSAYTNAHLQWSGFKKLPTVEPDEFKVARYLTVLSMFCKSPTVKAGYRQAAEAIVALHVEYKGF